MVKYFLEEEKADWHDSNQNDNTLLHAAVFRGHLEMATYLCEKKSSLINTKNKEKETPLHFAAMCS